jgi:cell division protein FtsB
LKSDLQYIGEVARDELGMVAEDELIYQFEPGKKEK